MARSSVNVRFESKRLVNRLHAAFELANEDLEAAIVGEIASPVWDWDGQTERQNGTTVSSPRNIIDEGELLDGYRALKRGKTRTAHVFDAEHTLAVHNGAAYADGHSVPGRPFTERPVEAFPEMFAKRFRESQ